MLNRASHRLADASDSATTGTAHHVIALRGTFAPRCCRACTPQRPASAFTPLAQLIAALLYRFAQAGIGSAVHSWHGGRFGGGYGAGTGRNRWYGDERNGADGYTWRGGTGGGAGWRGGGAGQWGDDLIVSQETTTATMEASEAEMVGFVHEHSSVHSHMLSMLSLAHGIRGDVTGDRTPKELEEAQFRVIQVTEEAPAPGATAARRGYERRTRTAWTGTPSARSESGSEMEPELLPGIEPVFRLHEAAQGSDTLEGGHVEEKVEVPGQDTGQRNAELGTTLPMPSQVSSAELPDLQVHVQGDTLQLQPEADHAVFELQLPSVEPAPAPGPAPAPVPAPEQRAPAVSMFHSLAHVSTSPMRSPSLCVAWTHDHKCVSLRRRDRS